MNLVTPAKETPDFGLLSALKTRSTFWKWRLFKRNTERLGRSTQLELNKNKRSHVNNIKRSDNCQKEKIMLFVVLVHQILRSKTLFENAFWLHLHILTLHTTNKDTYFCQPIPS